MKLLILTPYLPYPVNSGGNQGIFGLIDRLRRYMDISMLIPVSDRDKSNMDELQKIWTDITFYFYNKDDVERKKTDRKSFSYRWMMKLRDSLERKINRKNFSTGNDLVRKHFILTSQTPAFYLPNDEDYVNYVYETINSNKFDLIQVDFFELINIVNILPENIKKVFIHHEIRYVRADREFSLLAERRPTDRYLLNYSKNYEIGCLNAYNAIVTVTDTDNEKLKNLLKNDILIATSPAIMEIKERSYDKDFRFNNKLIFLGGSDHFPNHDGVDWFLNNCWNEIYESDPSLEFHVIGTWRSKLVDGYQSKFKNVVFRGFVEDLHNALNNSIMIVPLRIGSGVRIKILDALSAGVPIVTTSIGGEGLNLINKKDCLIADDSDDFIKGVLSVACDNDLCRQLISGAIQKLDNRPDPEALAKVRFDIYNQILNRR